MAWDKQRIVSIRVIPARMLCLPLCEAGLVSAGWGWCFSSSQMTEELASWAAPGTASAELVYKAQPQATTDAVNLCNCTQGV